MVLVDMDAKTATVVVPDYQLSLAIGKDGQNVRLAARLCSWKIDIKSHSQYFPEGHPDIDTDEPIIEYLESSAPAESEGGFEEADAEAEETISVSAIKRMKKAELIEFAEANGIEIDPKATNAAMIETILEAL